MSAMQSELPSQPESPDFSYLPPIIHETNSARIAGSVVNFTLRHIPGTELNSNVPAFFHNGLGAPEAAYADVADELAAHRYVVTLDPPRRQSPMHGLHPKHLLNPLLLQSQAAWAVKRSLMQTYGFETFDDIGHSTGGVTALSSALKHPDQTNQLLLVGSAGTTEHSTLSLLPASVAFFPKEFKPMLIEAISTGDIELAVESIAHFLKNPLRFGREAVVVSRADIRADIQKLAAIGKVVRTLTFEKDVFFPDTAGMPGAIHIEPQINPAGVAREIERKLSGQKASYELVA